MAFLVPRPELLVLLVLLVMLLVMQMVMELVLMMNPCSTWLQS
jgi:hypothetical protein